MDEELEVFGSGSVLKDLGLPDPEEALAKSRLAFAISRVIRQRGLTQSDAAALADIPQPKISLPIRGRSKDFSTDRHYRILKQARRKRIRGPSSRAELENGSHDHSGTRSPSKRGGIPNRRRHRYVKTNFSTLEKSLNLGRPDANVVSLLTRPDCVAVASRFPGCSRICVYRGGSDLSAK
jgi:predicted XRE-type DNA-binding protein